MTKDDIASLLDEMATILEVRGENAFKIRAFRNAARTLAGFEGDLQEAVRSGALRTMKGIGATLSAVIGDLVVHGRSAAYDDVKKSVPSGLIELLKIPGLGPKKTKILHERLAISSIGELEYACQENRLVALPGFGARSQTKILESLRSMDRYKGQFLQDAARRQAETLLSALRDAASIENIAVAGSLRRRKETVKDIDLIAASSAPEAVMTVFTGLPDVNSVTAKGETKSSVILKSGIAADLRVVSPNDFPFALHHSTGSKEHNTALRGHAKSIGIKMNEYGLFRGDDRIECRTEEEIYAALGLAYIPPELRENMGEIEAASRQEIPHLLSDDDIRGVFHNHTTYSDGSATAEAMVRRAKALGLSYIGISDHSQSAFYANGLKEDRIRAQQEELDEVGRRAGGIRIFKGIESDILADGALDYLPEILEGFDFVIASVHSRFQMDESSMTRRIIRAIENPNTTILGHPTGRLLLSRSPYAVDMDAVFEAAATHGVAIEINANPHRLDLDWRLCRRAKERGVRFCINPDAHSLEGLENTLYGVGVARKGWLVAKDVINTLPTEEMELYLADRK